MEATIRTNDKNLFNSLLLLFKSIHVTVETKNKKELITHKNFTPEDYEGILSHLNLNVDKELFNMRKTWKRNS